MNPQEIQKVIARDEKCVPSTERVKISSTNVRLETTVQQKEETFQVVIDVIKNCTCFKAFTITVEVLEISSSSTLSRRSKTQIRMNSFWLTRSALSMLKSLERFWIFIQELKVKTSLRYKKMMLPSPSSLNLATKVHYTSIPTCMWITCISHGELWQPLSTSVSLGRLLKFVRIGEDYQEYILPNPDMMLNDAIKRSESYKMFLKYSTGQIPPKKSRGKGLQGKKTIDTPVADVDVSKEFDSKPARKRTGSRRVVKKKVTISVVDNIIPNPNVALEFGKSISLTKATEEEAARQVHATHARIMTRSILEPARRRPSGITFRDTSQMSKKVSSDPSQKLKGTGGLSEGTGRIPRVLDESTVVFATYSERTRSEQESEYSKEDQGDDEEVDWIDFDEDEEKKDDTDDDKKQVNDDEDKEMTNAEVEESGNGDTKIFDAAKADVEKTEEVKDDANKAELPPTSSSLSISSVTKLEKDVFELKKIDHFAKALATLNSQVPMVFEQYLGSKISDDLQKKPTIDLEQESEKSVSEILKIKREQTEKQKMPKYTLKSTDKAALKVYNLKSTFYQTMHENKSFDRNPTNHPLYHALMEALIEDENAMDKGVADTVKNHKRQHDDDDDPSAGPNQGGMDDAFNTAGEDVVRDDDQPQDTSKPKTNKTSNQYWFKQPLRPPTPNPE
ncbi:hypothetical protein Tco_1509179 [Tanacetum coccineum]